MTHSEDPTSMSQFLRGSIAQLQLLNIGAQLPQWGFESGDLISMSADVESGHCLNVDAHA